MVTADELRALVELLARTPMTTAEGLWSQQLVNRLRTEIQEKAGKEQAGATGADRPGQAGDFASPL